MSEFITARQVQNEFRWRMLATVSALALTGYVVSSVVARAEEGEHPTVWIELGGQLEMMQGTGSNFTAPFMSATPEPDSYNNDIFLRNTRPARSAVGFEGKLTFKPKDSDWSLSASLRYGRSQTNRHSHQQGAQHSAPLYFRTVTGTAGIVPLYAAAFADAKMTYRESHMVLDFDVGRDVGIGMLGRSGASSVNAGVRFAQFSSKSEVNISARPSVTTLFLSSFSFRHPWALFNNYTLSGNALRNFSGIGPSLSWEASAAVLGNADAGELTFDWGVNAAVLFGRQSADVGHSTQAYHLGVICKRRRGNGSCVYGAGTQSLYSNGNVDSRSKSVVVPNLGGFASVSVRYPNVKVSLGYRSDFFFGAVDAGIDQRQTKNLGFQGPFATVSIGLGG